MNNEKEIVYSFEKDQAYISQWAIEQNQLASQIQNENTCLQSDFDNNRIRLIGGLDISYLKDDTSHACGCCVIYDILEKKVIYSDCIYEEITVPYIPGYLAYRELPIYRKLLEKIKDTEYWPSLFLVDGHGILHPRHCGSACMVGLEFDCPTIGVGKSQFCGDQFIKPNEQKIKCEGIDVCSSIQDWKNVHEQYLKMNQSIIPIYHYNIQLGNAYIPPNHTKAIYISIGHKISLSLATQITTSLCNYLIPEPIRFADHLSREYLRMKRNVSI